MTSAASSAPERPKRTNLVRALFVLVICGVVGGLLWALGQQDEASILVDEFDKESWIPVVDADEANWKALHSTYGDGNDELACLTPDNVAAVDSALQIVALDEPTRCPDGSMRDYSSGFLSSRDAGNYYPLFGRYEMRARIPHGQGLWPAFWLRHRDGASTAEVDVMESFHSQGPGEVTQTLHLPLSHGTGAVSESTFIEEPTAGTGGWHTYAVEITPGAEGAVRFTFFVDEARTLQFDDEQASAWVPQNQDAAWDVAVNLAVGGRYVGDPDAALGYLPYPHKCSLGYVDPPDGDPGQCSAAGILRAEFPALYEVDYVRFIPLEQLKQGTPPPAESTTG